MSIKRIRKDLVLETYRFPKTGSNPGFKKQFLTLSIEKAKLLEIIRTFYYNDLMDVPNENIFIECEGGISYGENLGEVTDEEPLTLRWGVKEKTLEPKKHTKKPKRKMDTGDFSIEIPFDGPEE